MSNLDTLERLGIIQSDVSLGPMTTYKCGGPARFMAIVRNRSELDELVASGLATELPVLVLGRGSNLVVADSGFPGLVIRLDGEFMRVWVDGTTVSGGGAAPLARLARESVSHGLNGLEFFVGIPGSVGGAVRQNAGCFGTETRDRLIAAQIVDLATGEGVSLKPEDLVMGYRRTNLSTTQLVVSADFGAIPGDTAAGLAEMRRVTRWRRDNQPGGTLNAGSVFKNPSGMAAGELIDRLGLKGTTVGGVSVSEKHANFFVAGDTATSADIKELVELVKDRVLEMSGTNLEPEIQFVGFDS